MDLEAVEAEAFENKTALLRDEERMGDYSPSIGPEVC